MEDSVNVLKFAECRAKEIMTLMSEVTQKEPKLSIQKLPFHMRRRAASHNPKRLPRSLRMKVPEESFAKHKKKSKPHKNWLDEYNSRQKTNTWLPTHIWFAKRFHMKELWGYKLPFQATGKRFRSSYRATMKNALIQDLSYFCCIELSGEEEKLVSKLSCLTDESVGMDFSSEAFIDGTKEGDCLIYHPNTFPLCALGPISFLWKPQIDSPMKEDDQVLTSDRQLWIWCHPSIREELVKILIEIFQLVEQTERPLKEYNFASHVNFKKCELHFQKEPVYIGDGVTMYVLKDTLIRHRIVGPNAQSVMTSVLQLDQISQLPEKEKVWRFISNPQSSYSVPIKTVIGVKVEDPRLHVTSKNVEGVQEDGDISEDSVLEEFSKPEIAYSDIWSYEVRNQVTAAQIPEAVINKEKGKLVVPEASDLRKCTTSVPVLVIQQPGINGYASGWDIIAPQGWGMAFWIPFIYHGVQPAGFDDLCYSNFECHRPTFPLSFPDTEAGFVFEENRRKENLKKYNRYSRAKRPNFKILGVPSPFFMPWSVLVSNWEKECSSKYNIATAIKSEKNNDSFFVLRDKTNISLLQNLCQILQKKNEQESMNALRNTLQALLTTQSINIKALLLVDIKCLHRGVPANCAGIYLPTETDLETLKTNPKDFGPVEMKHDIDDLSNMPARKRRKILKEEAKIESKKLDRPEIDSVISSCERKLIGYISEGGYSRLGSQGYGLGHCALTGILALFELCVKCHSNILVLIREQHSFQYRPAVIKISSCFF